MDRKPPFLGQVPLVLGPSSWGAQIPFVAQVPLQAPVPQTFYARIGAGDQWFTVGPFSSKEAAARAGAEQPGRFEVIDAAGRVVVI